MELKDVYGVLGFDPEKIKTLDDFKSSMDSTFTRTSNINEDSEPVKKIVGQVYSTLSTEIKKIAKNSDIELDYSSPELKDKKVKDRLVYFIDQLSGKHKSIVDELSMKASAGNDDKYKELENKYNRESQKAKDLQALLEKTSGDYNLLKDESSKKIKSIQIDVLKKDKFGAVVKGVISVLRGYQVSSIALILY